MTVLGHQRVDRVARLEIGQIGPRAEHPQRAELAPEFVRNEIVGIVGPGPPEAEVAEYLTRQQATSDPAIRAIGFVRDLLQDGVNVVTRERRPFPVGTTDRGFWVELHVLWIEGREE